jgi:putative FmdB family regulatory protein
MPIYEYECAACGHVFERVMKIGEVGTACPKCGDQETKKRISSFRTNAWSTFLDRMEKRVSPGKFK